jgi:hypothetical protein
LSRWFSHSSCVAAPFAFAGAQAARVIVSSLARRETNPRDDNATRAAL